jgi:hypothetical protein
MFEPQDRSRNCFREDKGPESKHKRFLPEFFSIIKRFMALKLLQYNILRAFSHIGNAISFPRQSRFWATPGGAPGCYGFGLANSPQ